MKENKLILVILDSVGVGELPDANEYNDEGANTLGNIANEIGGLNLPNLESFGLGNIIDIKGIKKKDFADACYGKLAEASKGKDSITGHWEITGIISERAFPVYPDGFPKSLLEKFLSVTGCKGYLGNKSASGTEIIKELGDEHVKTGFPIVYTSADSVFQIAAHEEVIQLEQLYEICRKTRKEVVVGEHSVGRVIARPFKGKSGKYVRTEYRRDFSVEPPRKTVLDYLYENNITTIGIGKIDDLFCGRGLTEKVHTKSNAEGIEAIIEYGKKMKSGLLMANLIDFDMLYGHRQDAKGYAKALEDFDSKLPDIKKSIYDGDLLIITADHGNDPTDKSTDHTREYVPLLCYGTTCKKNVNLGVRNSFADVGKTVADFFGLADSGFLAGTSFLQEMF